MEGSSVIRYFMHLRDGSQELLDPEGFEHQSLDALRKAVLATARDLIGTDARDGGVIDFRFRIDAEDEDGVLVYSLPFQHAVNIIPAGGGVNVIAGSFGVKH
jgi:hypothetical protein